jgi:predicted glycosyltransferase
LKQDLHCKNRERIRTYPGIKEDVYVPDFKPEPALAGQLELGKDQIIATVRPPATEAHYHNPESELLFVEFMKRAVQTPRVKVVLLPRNKAQESEIRQSWPQWFEGSKVTVPKQAVDGLNLLWHSDLVVSGGGTMNREAAALGVPVYSIFRGKSGAVDRHLESEGKMTLIQSVEDLHSRIQLQPRVRNGAHASSNREALRSVVDNVEAILNSDCQR